MIVQGRDRAAGNCANSDSPSGVIGAEGSGVGTRESLAEMNTQSCEIPPLRCAPVGKSNFGNEV
jgi:hypothetical protein